MSQWNNVFFELFDTFGLDDVVQLYYTSNMQSIKYRLALYNGYYKSYYYYLLLESFSHQCYLIIFHWSLSDSKSPQVSRALLSILAVLNNAVVWTVSIRPLPSKSSSPFNSPLVTVPNAPITIGIIVTFMFHSFLIP